MYKIPYGLFIVTSRVGGRDNGCVSNTFQQATVTPNQVSLCLNKQNLTTEMIQKSGVLTVSILSEEADFDLIKRFGFQSGRDVNKFKDFVACKRVANGTLAVTTGANAYISVRVTDTVDLGTHLMFIGEVTGMDSFSTAPSLTYEYYQKYIKPAPPKPEPHEGMRTVWRCKVCGFEYEGEELPPDYICPICKHPASDFEKVEIPGNLTERKE